MTTTRTEEEILLSEAGERLEDLQRAAVVIREKKEERTIVVFGDDERLEDLKSMVEVLQEKEGSSSRSLMSIFQKWAENPLIGVFLSGSLFLLLLFAVAKTEAFVEILRTLLDLFR